MAGKRFWKALVIFAVLSIAFSGAVGLVAGDEEPVVHVPAPKPGDSAFYTVREVIEDDELAQGSLSFNWARLTWMEEVVRPDASGQPVAVQPLRFDLAYGQGTEYAREWTAFTYYDPVTGMPVMESRDYLFAVAGGQGTAGLFAVEVSESAVTSTVYRGPLGPCGARTTLHGALEPPASLDVPGNCRDYSDMGWEQTTPYTLADHGVWNDHDALEYQDARGRRIVYAEDVPFPVTIEAGLESFVPEPYQIARHYELELKTVELATEPYPDRGPMPPPQPVPLVPRTEPLHIDDAALPGLTLAKAYETAMADTANPRLADFMAKPGAYVAGAWRNQLEDADGRVFHQWTLHVTDGRDVMAKVVREEPANAFLPEALAESDASQYRVEDREFETNRPLPMASQLPDVIPDLAVAMQQATRYPGIDTPNIWGFYVDCVTAGCSRPYFGLRVGEEHLATDSPAVGTQGHRWSQHTAFVGQDGLFSHTWDQEGDASDPILPLSAPPETEPQSRSGVQGPSVWNAPSAATMTSMGILAFLGAALYYFWPGLKVGGVGLFSRIRRDKVLDHPERRRLHDVISDRPGIHFKDLARDLEIGTTSLEHHLQKLQETGLIVRHAAPGYTCYFCKGQVDRRAMEMAPFMRSAKARDILAVVAAKPGVAVRDVAATIGVSPASVSYHVTRLRSAGILGTGRPLHLTPDGEDAWRAFGEA